jgi:hypothetical protein
VQAGHLKPSAWAKVTRGGALVGKPRGEDLGHHRGSSEAAMIFKVPPHLRTLFHIDIEIDIEHPFEQSGLC